MARFHCETPGRNSQLTASSITSSRTFYVIAESRAESDFDIFGATGMPVRYGDRHPRNVGVFALEWSATQDPRHWYKWTVEVGYTRPEENQDSENNPDDNPLLRMPDISYDTESVTIAATGERDADGNVTKGIVTSAGEPYDPHPEEEVEILLINITRWELPFFSVVDFLRLQNGVNDAAFTWGDATFEEGQAKVRIRIGATQQHTLKSPADPNDPNDRPGQIVRYRQHDILIAVSPLGWDLRLLDFGTYYNDDGAIKRFIEDGSDAKEMGLLDGAGGKLADGDPIGSNAVFNFWKNRTRVPFDFLALPAGP